MRRLSAREQQVLDLYDQGEELKEIATRLGVSEHTVCTYARRICRKSGCNSLRRAAWLRREVVATQR